MNIFMTYTNHTTLLYTTSHFLQRLLRIPLPSKYDKQNWLFQKIIQKNRSSAEDIPGRYIHQRDATIKGNGRAFDGLSLHFDRVPQAGRVAVKKTATKKDSQWHNSDVSKLASLDENVQRHVVAVASERCKKQSQWLYWNLNGSLETIRAAFSQ